MKKQKFFTTNNKKYTVFDYGSLHELIISYNYKIHFLLKVTIVNIPYMFGYKSVNAVSCGLITSLHSGHAGTFTQGLQ